MIAHSTHVCVDCRTVNKTCTNPEHKGLVFGSKWRVPAKDNDKAWERIANGEYLWDREAVRRKAIKHMRHWNERMFRGKEAVLEESEQRRKAILERLERVKQEKELGPPECGHDWCLWSYQQAVRLAESYEGCPRGPMETTKLS